MSAREEIGASLAQIRKDSEMLRIRQEAPELVRRAMERGEIRVPERRTGPPIRAPRPVRPGTAASLILRMLLEARGAWVGLDALSTRTGSGWRYVQGRIGVLRAAGHRIECNKPRGGCTAESQPAGYRIPVEEGPTR